MKQGLQFILASVLLAGGAAAGLCGPQVQTLAGEWQIRMDPAGEGIRKGWPGEVFAGDPARLPGTVFSNPRVPAAAKPEPGKGSLRGLTPVYSYAGAVWYQTEVVIPGTWRGKRIELFLERCQWETFVWVNDRLQGTRNSLVAPHVYDLSQALTPGRHRLTVMVDNANRHTGMEVSPDNLIKYLDLTTEVKRGAKLNCGGHHTWSYNWNGILGRLELRAHDPVSLSAADVYPEVAASSVGVRVTVRNLTGKKGKATLRAQWAARGQPDAHVAAAEWALELNGEAEQHVEHRLKAEKPVRAWDEFTPQLYTLALTLTAPDCADACSVDFGLRELGKRGTRFTLNGQPVFLRGTLEDFIFPLTGHPPVDVASWRKVIGIAKTYGLNLFRFHSCTPPDAAFTAADELGFYLQVEVPGTSCPSKDEAKSVEDFLSAELANLLKTYGNHPSLLLVSMGNEQLVAGAKSEFLAKHQEVLAKKVRFGQTVDPRHLYTSTTHPYRSDAPARIDDFYVSAWPVSGKEPLCGIRWGGGRVIDTSRFNTRPPETVFDYGPSLEGLDRPLLTHEVGQWAVYPDLREITRYHGAQRADNFVEIRERLRAKGLLEWSGDFTRASGMLALALYKEEIESALRTPGLGGFELLDIHDYPGQGTSTVGILSALWESKGLITPAQFRGFCSPVVLLARLLKRVWTNNETLEVRIDVANYGEGVSHGATSWSLQGTDGRLYGQGLLAATSVARGDVGTAGTVKAALSAVTAADKVVLRVERAGTNANAWNLWVYPSKVPADIPGGVQVAMRWDAAARDALRQGGAVLLLPKAEALKDPVPGTFTPVFWNVQMKHTQVSKTMGLLVNSADPALAGFPTDFHSDWQWWDPVMRSPVMRLDGLPQALRPCVAVIDSYTENRRLALVFEAKVGPGRLLVCSVDIADGLESRPVARQLRRSLLDYMAGPTFRPDVPVSEQELATLLK